jgi:hypothetical protein
MGTIKVATITQTGKAWPTKESIIRNSNPVRMPYSAIPKIPACINPVEKKELLAEFSVFK